MAASSCRRSSSAVLLGRAAAARSSLPRISSRHRSRLTSSAHSSARCRLVVFVEKLADRLDPRLDHPQPLIVEPLLEQGGRHGAGVHHQDVRPPLIELELVPIVLGVGPHEAKQPQVPRRVAGAQARTTPGARSSDSDGNIASPRATAGCNRLRSAEGGRIGVHLVVQLLLALVVVQPRLEALRTEAVGPAVHLHLQNPRSTRSWILLRPSSPGTIRTSTSSGSNGQSPSSRVRSFDMPELYARKPALPTSAGVVDGDCPNFRVSENGTVPFSAAAQQFCFRSARRHYNCRSNRQRQPRRPIRRDRGLPVP